jgi:hypothetical protein
VAPCATGGSRRFRGLCPLSYLSVKSRGGWLLRPAGAPSRWNRIPAETSATRGRVSTRLADRHVDRIPTPVPLRLPGLPVFSPFGGRGLAMLQARGGTPWGVNGDSDPSRSARQQQTSRRSTGSPRAGSEGDGKLATGGRLGQTSGDLRRHRRDGPHREPDERQTAPNPSTSWRGTLGNHGRPDERSDGERAGPRHPVSLRGRPRVNARAGCRTANSTQWLKEACAATRRR